jgi:hypothetical protein
MKVARLSYQSCSGFDGRVAGDIEPHEARIESPDSRFAEFRVTGRHLHIVALGDQTLGGVAAEALARASSRRLGMHSVCVCRW